MVTLPKLTEKQFQQQVVDLAKLRGWYVYHNPDSRRSVAGFPDLVLIRERVLWWELKTDKGRVKPEQKKVIEMLRDSGESVSVVRPKDWQWIEGMLK